AADALAEDEAGGGGIEPDADGPLVIERVQQAAKDAADEAAVERDAAFGDAGDDLRRLIGEAAPVFEHVEEARADDRAGHADERDLLGDFGGDAIAFREPHRERYAGNDADGGEQAMPRERERPDIEHHGVDIDV